jgi:hypothetical protein
MPLERSPPRTGPDAPDAQQADAPCHASLPQQHDLKQDSFSASQLLNVERCDHQLNSPHHLRVKRRPAMTVSTIRAIEPSQVHLPDRIHHEQREMVLRQPIPKIRRQQQLLITITRQEVLGHAVIVLTRIVQ